MENERPGDSRNYNDAASQPLYNSIEVVGETENSSKLAAYGFTPEEEVFEFFSNHLSLI